MKRTSRFTLLPLAFCMVWTVFGQEKTSSGQDQLMQPNQTEMVGARYHLESVSETNVITRTTVAGRLVKTTSDAAKYELSADVITLAASPDNWATRKRFTVLDSKITSGEQAAPILPPGTVVEVSILDSKNVYQVGDKRIEGVIASALENLISLHTAPVSDDEMFGINNHRKVGESWTVNTDAIRKELDDMNAQGGVISGSATLERGPNNYLILKGWFEVKDVLMPISPEVNSEKGEMRVQYSREIPLASDQNRTETQSLHIVEAGIPKKNKDLSVTVVMDETGKFTVRPITSDKKNLSSSPD